MDLGSIIAHERTVSKIKDDVRTTLKTEPKASQIQSSLLEEIIKDSIEESVASIRMGISSWIVSSDTFVDA